MTRGRKSVPAAGPSLTPCRDPRRALTEITPYQEPDPRFARAGCPQAGRTENFPRELDLNSSSLEAARRSPPRTRPSRSGSASRWPGTSASRSSTCLPRRVDPSPLTRITAISNSGLRSIGQITRQTSSGSASIWVMKTGMAHGFPRAAMPGIAFDPPPRAKPPARVNLPPPESGSPADPVVSRLAGESGRRDERCGFPFVPGARMSPCLRARSRVCVPGNRPRPRHPQRCLLEEDLR